MLFVLHTSREMNFFARKHSRHFLFLETFDHVLHNGEIPVDQVSPMFISEHANTWDTKQTLQILFFHNPKSFFVIPKVC